MTKTTTFLNSSKLGDVIYSLPGISAHCKRSNTKARIYLRTNVKCINNPTGLQNIEEIMLTNEGYESLRPLLLHQDFVEDVREFGGEPIDFNLDMIRQMKISAPYGNIIRWYSYGFPQMHANLDDIWLTYKPVSETYEIANNAIIFSLSNNYRNHWISYEFLNIFHTQYPIYFIGLEHEAQEFVNKVPRAQWLMCEDFNDIANALAGCKVFIGNQNAVFAVAEGLKIPRILEICPWANNVIPQGKNGYDFHTQGALEYFLKEVIKEEPTSHL